MLNIYIHEDIGPGFLRESLKNIITQAGHTLVDHPEEASYLIGYLMADFGEVDNNKKIILTELKDLPSSLEGATAVKFGALIVNANLSLKDWLKKAPDLLAEEL